MTILYLIVISFALIGITKADGNHETVLAEQLDRYCAVRYETLMGDQNRILPKRRGKAGIQGRPGRNGERGPPGIVDYDVIDEIITRKIASQNRILPKKGETGIQGRPGQSGERGPPGIVDYDVIDEIITSKIASLLVPTDCTSIPLGLAKVQNTTGGVFHIYPENFKYGTEVYCDFETEGGGWLVFQRRMDGSQDFNQTWDEYVKGFGAFEGEFWLGLEKLHKLTTARKYELRVDLVAWDDVRAYAKYSTFSIGDASTKYKLTVSGHSGTMGDSFSQHSGMKFSTRDQDNDNSGHCGKLWQSGWWFDKCFFSNLNGRYRLERGLLEGWEGIHWQAWKKKQSMKFVEMKIRPLL